MKPIKAVKFHIFAIICTLAVIIPGTSGSAESSDTPPEKSFYFIKSVMSGNANKGYWDQPGHHGRYKQGLNLMAWSKDGDPDQQFRFVKAGAGWYYIVSRNGGYVDVSGGNNRDGVNVQIWSSNRSTSQKFRFRHLGNGRWKIYAFHGRALCLDNRTDKNGTNIHIWNDHNGPWMEWFLEDYRTGERYAPASKISGSLTALDFEKNGRGTSVNPGSTTIEVWHVDRSDPKNMYKKIKDIRTNIRGDFSLDESLMNEESLFLISRSNDSSSAYINAYPRSHKSGDLKLVTEKHNTGDYVLVDTLYRGKQYYYEQGGYFYRKNGIITNRQDFYFPSLTSVNRGNPAVKKLLGAIGGGAPAKSDDEIARRIESVMAFFRTGIKGSIGNTDSKVSSASDFLYSNCRASTTAPVNRWPSFQEMADTYQKYGFIPAGNCTANSQIAATLLYMAGVPADRFFVAKFHYDMSWYVEHWVLAVNMEGRWFALDPQHNRVIKIQSADDFKRHAWERYLSKAYDYKKPFEAWLLPGSKIKAVPYLGDPSELREIIAAEKQSRFFH